MAKTLKAAAVAAVSLFAVGAGFIAMQSNATEHDIDAFEDRVARLGATLSTPRFDPARLSALPEPVQRFFRFTFPSPPAGYQVVRVSASGDFRRPGAEAFNQTGAEQVIAAGVPALMFSATTPIMPGVWARAYDFFADGQMEMKAKVLSAFTVVDEKATPELDRISLRRWLLESSLYPAALLPGGPVTWEAIDATSARAVVSMNGMSATMRAFFDADGGLTHMVAEADGDLSTPYHGSGEHVTRSDYRLVDGQMIPMAFTISRMAAGQTYPFWKGRIDHISFE